VGIRDEALLALELAGDVLGRLPLLAPEAPDEPEEDALGDEEPEADQRQDQQDQEVDVLGVGRCRRNPTFDHVRDLEELRG
jgi:hypothetical protein